MPTRRAIEENLDPFLSKTLYTLARGKYMDTFHSNKIIVIYNV